MRELKFIQACPDDNYYTWQVHLWLESLRNIGHSDKAVSLIFTPKYRPKSDKWQKIVDLYPEAEFVFYTDEHDVTGSLFVYIPVLRPYVLMRYWQDHPEMKDNAVFYCDSDVVFTDKFNVDAYKDDDINYLSDTNSYINASYFDSKIKDVLSDKLEEYKTIDVLGELTKACGITRQIAEDNNDHSGGAQYFLKNIDAEFWKKVISDCLTIRTYLSEINQKYFASENTGFQSWCSDMWAVLWGIWCRNQKTQNISEMEFSWGTDNIERVHSLGIFHNAGISNKDMGEYPAFYKGAYHRGNDPFEDPHLEHVYNSEAAKEKGTHYYVEQLIKLKKKYKLNY